MKNLYKLFKKTNWKNRISRKVSTFIGFLYNGCTILSKVPINSIHTAVHTQTLMIPQFTNNHILIYCELADLRVHTSKSSSLRCVELLQLCPCKSYKFMETFIFTCEWGCLRKSDIRIILIIIQLWFLTRCWSMTVRICKLGLCVFFTLYL